MKTKLRQVSTVNMKQYLKLSYLCQSFSENVIKLGFPMYTDAGLPPVFRIEIMSYIYGFICKTLFILYRDFIYSKIWKRIIEVSQLLTFKLNNIFPKDFIFVVFHVHLRCFWEIFKLKIVQSEKKQVHLLIIFKLLHVTYLKKKI